MATLVKSLKKIVTCSARRLSQIVSFENQTWAIKGCFAYLLLPCLFELWSQKTHRKEENRTRQCSQHWQVSVTGACHLERGSFFFLPHCQK
jgi:hypothetical protein